MTFAYPSVQQFKDYFFRDFPYGTDQAKNVVDADIAKAFQQANCNFNEDFWRDQSSFEVGYFYLSAFYLVYDMQTSSQGLASTASWVETAKSVGNVSQSFAIPQRILDNPELAIYGQNKYGMKYLSLILPQLSGQIFGVIGSTRP